MRVDINLATQPYEDARQYWVRSGGALVALGIVSVLLLSLRDQRLDRGSQRPATHAEIR